MFKKTISLILAFTLLNLSVAHAQIDRCGFMKMKQSRIEDMRAALKAMQDLQDERSRARDIRDLLVDTNDSREIALLAEALDNEAKALASDGGFNRNIAVGSGLGSVILAGILYSRLKSSAQGANVLARLMTAIKGANKTLVGKILTGSFVVSIASALWFAKRAGEIADKREFLVTLIAKLDTLKDLADQIVALEEELEQEEIAFKMRVDELQEQGISCN